MEEQKATASKIIKHIYRVGKVVGNIFFGMLLVIIVLLTFSLVRVRMVGGPPSVAGHQMYIVLSGSMSPAFDAGSLVFVKPVAVGEIQEGDVVTFRNLGDGEVVVTHRVIAVEETEEGIAFRTKGDANNVEDPDLLPAGNVIGKVIFALPYMGYLMNYSQTKSGILTFVFIPAGLLLIFGSINLYKGMKALEKGKEDQGESQKEISM
jgi:signal peptidase